MGTQTKSKDDQPQAQHAKKPAPKKSSASKSDLVMRSLGRKAGASMEGLCKLTDWQPHSVRGFLSGTVRKKLGHEVSRQKDIKGITRYHLEKPERRS